MSDMTKQLSPSVRRRIIASELKRLRAEAGVPRETVEQAVELRRNALYRYESGESAMQIPVARALFGYYDVDGGRLETMVDLVRDSRNRGWLKKDDERGNPPWLADFLALERDASDIYQLSLTTIPGRLQTEAYARAVLEAGILGADVEAQVKARMSRSMDSSITTAFSYWLVLSEGALRRLVGGKVVMCEQLERLIEVAQRPETTLQVLPNDSGAHPSMGTQFVLMKYEVAPEFAVVYMEFLTGALYHDEPHETTAYDKAFRHLTKAALPERQSLSLIRTILKEWHT